MLCRFRPITFTRWNQVDSTSATLTPIALPSGCALSEPILQLRWALCGMCWSVRLHIARGRWQDVGRAASFQTATNDSSTTSPPVLRTQSLSAWAPYSLSASEVGNSSDPNSRTELTTLWCYRRHACPRSTAPHDACSRPL